MNVHAQVTSLIDEMRGALATHNVRKFEAASDSLEVLVRAYVEPVPRDLEWDFLGLNCQQRRIVDLLHSRLNKQTSRDALLSALHFDFADRPECDRKTIDVHMCRIRKALREFNQPFHIETVWAFGYKMIPA